MAFYLYDKNGYVDQIATYQGLQDLLAKHIHALNDFLTSGGLDTESEKIRVIDAIKHEKGLEYLKALLEDAQPPLIVSDGLDSRVDQFHPESDFTTPPREDSILSVDDAKRVYEKYAGEPWDTSQQ